MNAATALVLHAGAGDICWRKRAYVASACILGHVMGSNVCFQSGYFKGVAVEALYWLPC